MDNVRIIDLYDLSHTAAKDYLIQFEFPWQALAGIKAEILSLIEKVKDNPDYIKLADEVYAHKSAKIAPTACINGPCLIGEETEVRHCAFIRGSALIGKNCVIGNSTELKNVIIFDNVQVPHFNYAGDSILGYRSHMAAGAITANVKADKTNIVIKGSGESCATGLRKVGAFLGDYADIGCNSVLFPGTVVGRETRVYPLVSVRGVIPSGSILKTGAVLVKKEG